jgi:hypothetical protein
MNQHFTVMVRKVDKDDSEMTRAKIVEQFLWWVVIGLKKHTDAATWLNMGGPQVEAFIEALSTGGTHPFLRTWEERKAMAGRPPPPEHELRARRLVVLMCMALERAGLNKRAARRFAAKELAHSGVFANAPSHKTIEHWQERQPPLTPADEQLVATGIACCGLKEHRRLAIYFIGLAHFAHNPTAVVVREAAE